MGLFRHQPEMEVSTPGPHKLGHLAEQRETEELNGFLGICCGTGLSLLFWAGFFLLLRVL